METTIEELEDDVKNLRRQLACERDAEQRALLQLDLAHVRKQLDEARKNECDNGACPCQR